MDINYLITNFTPWIRCIAQTGSSILPWIKNSHDVDYVIYVEDLENPIREQVFTNKPKNECWFIFNKQKLRDPKIYSYQRHFQKILYGTPTREEYDIFENEIEYKQHLIQYGLGKPFEPQYKTMYHVLTAIYLFDNGEYSITEEQAKNIQLCHDREMTQEIYNFIQTRLKEWDLKINHPFDQEEVNDEQQQ